MFRGWNGKSGIVLVHTPSLCDSNHSLGSVLKPPFWISPPLPPVMSLDFMLKVLEGCSLVKFGDIFSPSGNVKEEYSVGLTKYFRAMLLCNSCGARTVSRFKKVSFKILKKCFHASEELSSV